MVGCLAVLPCQCSIPRLLCKSEVTIVHVTKQRWHDSKLRGPQAVANGRFHMLVALQPNHIAHT